MRRVNMGIPSSVDNFCRSHWKFIEKHHLLASAEKLLEELPRQEEFKFGHIPLTDHQAQWWNQLDDVRTPTKQWSERHCRKVRTGAHAWSPRHKAPTKELECWTATRRSFQGKRVSKHHSMRLAKEVQTECDPNWTLDHVTAMKLRAHKAKRAAEAKAEEHRDEFVAEQDTRARTRLEKQRAKRMHQKRQRERQRRDARKIRMSLGKLHNGGISMALAPDETGAMTERRTKEEMEEACLIENNRRFRQSGGTPFTRPPLLDLLGPMADTPAAEEILAGTFETPADVDPCAARLIDNLKMPESVGQGAPCNVELDVDDFHKGWNQAKEFTSSSHSGIHFGHCKAAVTHPGIRRFEAIMSNICHRSGHSPPRWKKGVNVMLEKKEGDFRVHRLRTILLCEADFNQNNKLCGRDMMRNAERHQTLAREQCGSRVGHSALIPCLNKRWTFDIVRQKRIAAAFLSSDLVSCCDRIVHNAAALAMRATGMPSGPIFGVFHTVQHLEHFIRTAFGDSEISFQSHDADAAEPIGGTGQGNGASPTIWAVVSTPVLDMLRKAGCVCAFKSAITGEGMVFVGFAFVDDTDKMVTCPSPDGTHEEVLELIQKTADEWEGGMRATGGAVGSDKSFWCLIGFNWKDGNWSCASNGDLPAAITVLDEDGERQTLTRLEPTEARRTLGAHLAPVGDEDAMVAALKEKANKWADATRSGHLAQSLVWQSLNTTVMKSSEWPLAVTCMTEQQCHEIMKPIIQVGLSRSGINRHFPRALVHGPIKCQGLGLPKPHHTQLKAHLQELVTWGHSASPQGQPLRCTSEQLKLELGVPGPVFKNSFQQLGCIATESWMKFTWESMQQFDIVVLDTTPDVPQRTAQDRHLIQEFCAAGHSGRELHRLNTCRLFLQVVTVSDVLCADLCTVAQSAWKGTRSQKWRQNLQWPNQGPPTSSDWQLWQQALAKSLHLTRQQRLPQHKSVGSWCEDRQQWDWFLDPANDSLCERTPSGQMQRCRRCAGRPSRNALGRFALAEEVAAVPDSAVRASVDKQGSLWCVKAVERRSHLPPSGSSIPVSVASTLVQAKGPLPANMQWAVQDLAFNDEADNGVKSAAAIQSSEGATAVSDGSFKDALGTACCTLEGDTSQGGVSCPVVVPGRSSDHSAHRSELAGLLGVVVCVHLLCKLHHITSGTVTVACDGLAALRNSMEHEGEVPPTTQHFDLIMAIRTWMKKSPVTWKTKHVKGHQDDKNPMHVLDRWATLNQAMDLRAKARLRQLQADIRQGRAHLPSLSIDGEPWPMHVNGEKVSKDFVQKFCDHVSGPVALAHWQQEVGRFGQGSREDVDWLAVNDGMKMLPRHRQRWITQQAAGWGGVGKWMLRCGEWPHSKCPRCNEPLEDTEHVLLCKGAGADGAMRNLLEDLRHWLCRKHTQLDTADALVAGLHSWHSGGSATSEDWSPELQEVLHRQESLGWRAMLEGLPAKGWADLQQQHFDRSQSRRTGRRWLATVVAELVELSFKMWQHRNDVNDTGETSTVSLEVNKAIEAEHVKGFWMLPADSRQLGGKPKQQVLRLALSRRQHWLRSIQAARSHQDHLKEKNRVPRWALDTIGVAEWHRRGKPRDPAGTGGRQQ